MGKCYATDLIWDVDFGHYLQFRLYCDLYKLLVSNVLEVRNWHVFSW